MEYTSLILLVLVVIWINLHHKLSKIQRKMEEFSTEIAALRKRLESGIPSEKERTEAKEPPELVPSIPHIIPPAKPQPPIRKPGKSINYEKYIGEKLFGKIGILALVLGMGLFIKYAIDKDWINETLRIILGFGVGGLLLGVAWHLRDTYRTFSSLLAGGAFAIFYITIAIAYHYYELLHPTAAFGFLIVLVGFMTFLSDRYERRELAITALVGGFIAPFLVGGGDQGYGILFTYVMILDLGMFGLSTHRKWGELPVICFALTWIVFAGYAYATDVEGLERVERTHLQLFACAFYLIFLLSVASIVRINTRKINQCLLGVIGLNSFLFLGFSLWLLSHIEPDLNLNGIITLFVAITDGLLFLWVRHKGDSFRFLGQTLLGMALTFLSATIPIQLGSTFITLFWASEVMILLGLYRRFHLRIYALFASMLAILTFGSYALDVFHGVGAWTRKTSLFINGLFATGLFTGLAYWADARLSRTTRLPSAYFCLAGCAVLYVAFITDLLLHVHPLLVSCSYAVAFTIAALGTANAFLGRSYLPISRYAKAYGSFAGLSTLLFVGMSYWVGAESGRFIPRLSLWISWVLLGGHLYILGQQYYRAFDVREKRTRSMTSYLCLLSTILLAGGTYNLLNQSGYPDEVNAGFSVSLSIAGFTQMAIGMRRHLKILRMISLATFSVVLFKLVIVDLWLLPTVGKIAVFIILGIILLVLSFLYQKLKNALFDQDP